MKGDESGVQEPYDIILVNTVLCSNNTQSFLGDCVLLIYCLADLFTVNRNICVEDHLFYTILIKGSPHCFILLHYCITWSCRSCRYIIQGCGNDLVTCTVIIVQIEFPFHKCDINMVSHHMQTPQSENINLVCIFMLIKTCIFVTIQKQCLQWLLLPVQLKTDSPTNVPLLWCLPLCNRPCENKAY